MGSVATRRSALLFCVMFVLVGCQAQEDDVTDATDPADAEDEAADVREMTIRLQSTFDEANTPSTMGFKPFQDAVARHSDGAMEVEWTGGPEAINPFEIGQSIGTGAFDVAMTSAAYYSDVVPESMVFIFSERTPAEERELGALERISEIHEEAIGGVVLGRAAYGHKYSFFSQDPIESTADFEGRRFRSTAGYQPVTDPLGVEAVVMPPGDLYTALERGVVEGYAWPNLGSTDFGFEELVNYQILPEFYTGDVIFIVDLDFWEDLSPAEQDVLIQAAQDVEEATPALYEDAIAEEREAMEEAGVEQIELSDPDAFLDIVSEATATWMRENVQPEELAEELIELFIPGAEN